MGPVKIPIKNTVGCTIASKHDRAVKNTLVGNRYRIKNQLGEGGMASVYLAVDEKLDRKVAIKTLSKEQTQDQQALKKFLVNAREIAKLDHQNIID